tara:strand:- start:1179 stop:1385 length:207 start_codon:yes stop_codon:yes gene_type:complete
MATKQEMREAIFGKLKSLFSKGKKPPKSVEDRINADPQLKKMYADLMKRGEKLTKKSDAILKKLAAQE